MKAKVRISMGLPSVVFVVLLTLKLANVTDISWFWVFFPLILTASGVALALTSMFIVFVFTQCRGP